ncbi:MAG: PulJ/GspJ family protein [Armatimonadota bacterium]
MKRSSPASSTAGVPAGRGGFTLAELMVATTITALVLSSLCGVYFATAGEWERQQGEADALVATSQTCARLADYVSQATGVVINTRFTPNDTLAVNLPADRAYGSYAPVWGGNVVRYRSGSWVIFYLSDSSGSYLTNGSILWAATFTWAGFPASVVPDRAWSMYYNTQLGRTASIRTIRFALDSSGSYPSVTITVASAYRIGGTEKQLTQSRTVCVRNAN